MIMNVMRCDGSNDQCGQRLLSHLCDVTFDRFVMSSASGDALHELLQLDGCVRHLLRSRVDGTPATSHA